MKFRVFRENKKEILLAGLLILAGNILGGCLLFLEQKETQIEYLDRNPFGEGAYEESLKVRTGGKEQTIKILVEEQQYTEKEKAQYLKEAEEELDAWMEGAVDKNGCISKDTQFLQELPDNPVRLSWNTDQEELVDGRKNVRLMCFLTLDEDMEIWEKTVEIRTKEGDGEEELQWAIQKETDEINEKNSLKCYLPKTINGEEVTYQREQAKTGMVVCLCSCILGVGIFPLKREKEKQEKQKRMSEMQVDYPDIIERLILFLKAGFSIRRSLEKLAFYYMRDKEKYHRKERHAYEEIVRTCREMEGGVYEKEAYERLGKRCVLPEYKVLSVLLIQNLQRGNQSILDLLEREAVCARDERRRRAKVRGEEASTKLLLPMVLQLIVVLVILMVPAFLSFA